MQFIKVPKKMCSIFPCVTVISMPSIAYFLSMVFLIDDRWPMRTGTKAAGLGEREPDEADTSADAV